MTVSATLLVKDPPLDRLVALVAYLRCCAYRCDPENVKHQADAEREYARFTQLARGL